MKEPAYIKETKVMAASPVTSWKIEGGKVAVMTVFLFMASKITVDGDCKHEIRKHLLLGRKVKTNIESMLKSRGITLLTKVHRVKVMVFPVITYSCETWTIKKAECQIIDAFKLWCWRRLLKVPCTARRSNMSILRESTLNSHWKDQDAEAEALVFWSTNANS